MPGLTVTEKEHWKDRIAKRIDHQIERLRAAHPAVFDAVRREAKSRVMTSLGLTEVEQELEQIDLDEKKLDRRSKRLHRTMLSKVRNVPVEDVEEEEWYRAEEEVKTARRRREAMIEEELLAEQEIGRRVLELKAERENLLDTVWLSTSSAQLKSLWAKVAELLGDEQTPLQRAALAIAPVND